MHQFTTKMDSRLQEIKRVFAVVSQESQDICSIISETVTKNNAINVIDKEKSPKKSGELCPQRVLNFSD